MKLIKTSFFSAIITIIRISSGFVGGKIIAVLTGPAGVALVGAFTNFITIVLNFGNGAINAGVVKYTAEYTEDENKLKQLFSTSFKITLYCSVCVGFLIIILARYLSIWILHDVNYSNVIIILGISLIFYSLNTLLISILNGRGDIKKYTIVNTIGSVIGLLLTILLVFYYKIAGALYSMVLSQTVVFFITVFLLRKVNWFSWSYFKLQFDKVLGIKLSHYSLMATVSALTVPVSQIILRNMLINKLGVDSAGYWQGMMRVSDGYLMLITTTLGTYYLPKLSILQSNRELRKEILNGYKIILPIVFVGCVLIYFLRFFIINILYTSDFIKMESLFFWQLLGDFFKMSAWILAFLMLAKAKTKLYIISEISFSVLFVVLGYAFVEYFGIKGITFSFALSYFFYMLTLIFFFRKLLFNLNK